MEAGSVAHVPACMCACLVFSLSLPGSVSYYHLSSPNGRGLMALVTQERMPSHA